MKQLYLAVSIVFTLAACNLGRGFKPPPNANSLESWGNRNGISQKTIDSAMIECGYTILEYGYGTDQTDNGSAQRIECMFSKNFYFKSGWGGICSNPTDRVTLPACANVPIRSRNSYYGN